MNSAGGHPVFGHSTGKAKPTTISATNVYAGEVGAAPHRRAPGERCVAESVSRSACPPSAAGRVGFQTGKDREASKGDREKYLTAKYPKSQMSMIRRRLAVEDWVDAELKKMYDISDDDLQTYDAVVDLDELLDLDTDPERQQYIEEQIANAPKSQAVASKFVRELLEKLNTL